MNTREARQIIRNIRNEISQRAATPDPVRDAPRAEAERYMAEMNEASTRLMIRGIYGHDPAHFAPERITPTEAQHRQIAFERSMRGAGVTGDVLARKLEWHAGTLAQITVAG